MVSVLSFLGGTVFGIMLSTWYTSHLARPRLEVVGVVSGKYTPGYSAYQLAIQNNRGFFGIRLKPPSFFGRFMLSGFRKGYIVESQTAHGCTAWLYDKRGGGHPTGLYWRLEPGQPPTNLVTLGSGQTADLLLFARLEEEPTRYFVFQPDGAERPAIPDERIAEDREYILELTCSDGLHKARIPVAMRQQPTGPVYMEL